MIDNTYRPHLPNDSKYLAEVAGKIAKNAPTDIRFDYLSDLFALVWLQNPFELIDINSLNNPLLKGLFQDFYRKITLQFSDNDKIIEALYTLWDYLSESDPLERVDIIFVFGGPEWAYRVREAVRLYQEGYASTLLFSWNKSSFMKEVTVTEAEFYRQIALELGVKDTDIICEIESVNTPENVVYSLKKLDLLGYKPEKMIGITLNYHMRRAALTFKSASRSTSINQIQMLRAPISPPKFQREEYFLNEELLSYVLYEYIKMYGARLMAHF